MAVDDGNTIKAAHEVELADGTIAQNVFYFICNFATQDTNANVLAAVKQYIEDMYNAVGGSLSNTLTINPCEVDKIAWNPAEGIWKTTATVGTTTPSYTHSDGTDQAPNQVAPIVRANTSRPKSYGKKFLIGFTEAAMNGSDLESAVLTNLATTLAHYLADETVSGTNVLSPGVPRTGVNEFLEFTDGVVNSVVGTQRRRKPGVGG